MDDGKKPRKIRNIAELARIAGVSAGTVSRALADKSLVNKETRERIQAIARAHGFRPNQMARRLRTRQTGVIGVVIAPGQDRSSPISDPFFATLLGHLADELARTGQDIMLSRVIPGDAEWLDRIVDSGMVDGALVIGQSDQTSTIERVARHYKPMVVWGSHREGQVQCTVGGNNAAGGTLAAQRLLARGARHIAFFGDTKEPQVADRLTGVEQALEGCPDATLRVFPVPYPNDRMPARIAAHLDDLADAVDGIVCATDVIAMVTIRLLHERGVPVPGQVAVTGYGDLPLIRCMTPQLTTVRHDFARGAQAMVDALHRRIAGEDAQQMVMQPELVIRESA